MAEELEQLADLQNHLEISDGTVNPAKAAEAVAKAADLDEQATEKERQASRQEIRLQYLSSLNGQLVIAGLPVPQPATATYSLLTVIDSPFVTGAFGPDGLAAADIIKALYVLVEREKVLDTLFVSTHANARIEATSRIAEKSPEFYEKYLDALAQNATGFARFERDAMKWGERLGVFDLDEVGRQIVEYMRLSHAGWELIPTDDDDSKKKT